MNKAWSASLPGTVPSTSHVNIRRRDRDVKLKRVGWGRGTTAHADGTRARAHRARTKLGEHLMPPPPSQNLAPNVLCVLVFVFISWCRRGGRIRVAGRHWRRHTACTRGRTASCAGPEKRVAETLAQVKPAPCTPWGSSVRISLLAAVRRASLSFADLAHVRWLLLPPNTSLSCDRWAQRRNRRAQKAGHLPCNALQLQRCAAGALPQPRCLPRSK